MDLGKTLTDAALTIGGGIGSIFAGPEVGVAAKAADIAADQGWNAKEKSDALKLGSGPAPAQASGPAGLTAVPSNAAAGGVTAAQPSGAESAGMKTMGPGMDDKSPAAAAPAGPDTSAAGTGGLKALGPQAPGFTFPTTPDDTLDPNQAKAKPIDWGGALQDFGKNIQAMNHGGYNQIFGDAGKIGSQSVVPPVQAPRIAPAPGIAVGTPQIPQVAPPPVLPPPPIASDRRLKTNVSQSTTQLYAFLDSLYGVRQ